MAYQFSEGFDVYGTAANMVTANRYPGANLLTPAGIVYSATGGKFGGGCITNSVSGGYPTALPFFVNIASGVTFYVAGWWKNSPNSGSNTGAYYSMIMDGAGNNLISCNGSNLVLVNKTNIVATGTTYIADGWHWIECSFLFNGASSQVTAYVDGIQQFTGTYNLSNFPAQALTKLSVGTGVGAVANPSALSCMDDFIVWDNTGTTFNTFPLGARRIGLMTPNGAGASTQFSSSGASANWQNASQAWGGTAYNADGGTGNYDLFTMSALPYTPQVINAVTVQVQAQNPGADGNHNVITKLQSSGAIASGASRVLTATNVIYSDAYTKDGAGNAWTLANLNAAQCGYGD